ncbi:MAG TPA: ABC transporter permease [Candidatus Sulfomarinibacteraceae bacterium]|nr:ABC transporter permease [Candidatus Sulfomarinibacteraceae bacterium]
MQIELPAPRWEAFRKLLGANESVISFSIALAAVLFALGVGAILILMAGINPLVAYGYLLEATIGNTYGFGETLTRFIPLAFAGVGFSMAYQAGFFNVGVEGQLYLGALGAVIAGVLLPEMPALLHIPLALLLGAAGGAIWAHIAGLLRIYLGADELINTMMLNYIAVLVVSLLVQGVLKDPNSMTFQSEALPASARLPFIMPGTNLHLGFVLAIVAVFGIHYLMKHTPLGFKMRAIGHNEDAASYAGMGIASGMTMAVLISGALAGLGGAVELMGTQYRLQAGFSPGYGFDGIGVAIMGKKSPIGLILAALLFAMIRVGAGAMQRGIGVPAPLLSVIQGLIIIAVIASDYFIRKRARRVGGRA